MKKLKPYVIIFLFVHYIFSMYGKSFHPFNWTGDTVYFYGCCLFIGFFGIFMWNYLNQEK